MNLRYVRIDYWTGDEHIGAISGLELI